MYRVAVGVLVCLVVAVVPAAKDRQFAARVIYVNKGLITVEPMLPPVLEMEQTAGPKVRMSVLIHCTEHNKIENVVQDGVKRKVRVLMFRCEEGRELEVRGISFMGRTAW